MKRKLGLGKASQNKKSKQQDSAKDTSAEEQVLTVELPSQSANDGEFGELVGLWDTYLDSDQGELVLNGVINECDRLERNPPKETDAHDKNTFLAIYSMGLSEMSKYHEDDSLGWIEFALEKSQKLDGSLGGFVKCFIGLNELGCRIGQLSLQEEGTESSSDFDFLKGFQNVVDNWNKSMKAPEAEVKPLLQKKWVLSILDTLDDLLELIDNFNHENQAEVLDSDNEEEEEDEDIEDLLKEKNNDLPADHPLYAVQQSDDFNTFWRSAMISIKDLVEPGTSLSRGVFKKLGQSYLMEAENPILVYTSLTYEQGPDVKPTKEETEQAKAAQKDAKELVGTALDYLSKTWDDEDVQSWVDIAEAEITMGNLFEEGPEQEDWYAKAEKKLKMANNSSHGKYQAILDSLKG